MADKPSREIILESTQVGNARRVTAIDVASATEVTFQAPLYASAGEIRKLAVSKLAYVLRTKKN